MEALNRGRALALFGVAALGGLAGCARGSSEQPIRVGSKNFTEELFLGELYAQVLEGHGFKVERKLSLGSIEIAMAALQRGEIDLYPEYTGTALLVQLKAAPSSDARAIYQTVKSAYEKQYAATWLDPAPFNDTQAIASSKAIAQRYNLRTLSDVSKAAPQLRLGSIPEFLRRPDGLPGLQRAYGGFKFKEIRQIDIGLKYKALVGGQVDVVVAFSTEGPIAQYDLVVFDDDKHVFPPYQVAPVVRQDALSRSPGIATHLNKIAPQLTDAVMRATNDQIDGKAKRDVVDVAREFVKAHGLA